MINDQKIYTLMLKTESIRAVQIADALDEELVDVSSALKALVDVGDVVRTPGTVVELQRGGVTLDKLDRDEAVVLRDFLNRVLPQSI